MVGYLDEAFRGSREAPSELYERKTKNRTSQVLRVINLGIAKTNHAKSQRYLKGLRI